MQTNAKQCKYFNPRPPWGGRLGSKRSRYQCQHFNPRPPWGGRPIKGNQKSTPTRYFNPRPPWGGRRARYSSCGKSSQFQSTPSVGRATTSRLCRVNVVNLISIHALRGEGDDAAIVFDSSIQANFNPRPPWGGRPTQPPYIPAILFISIHALRGEGDNMKELKKLDSWISIHALRGEGDASGRWSPASQDPFQSTPSVGRATKTVKSET